MFTLQKKLKHKYWYPISVDIEIRLRKFRRFIDKLYRKYWWVVFVLVMAPYIGFAAYRMHKEYTFIHNYANLDAPFSNFYTKWNTDGNPGQDPPK
jgi:hypothetical protein